MPDYPLAEKAPEQLKTPSGLAFHDITLEAVLAGEVESIKPSGRGGEAGRRYSSWRTIWRIGGKPGDVPRW